MGLDDLNGYIMTNKYTNIDNIVVSKKGVKIFEQNYNKKYLNKKHYIASILKSVISLGVGVAVQKKLINVEDSVCDYFPEYFSGKNMYKRIKIKHLLTLSSGIYWRFGIHGSQPLWGRIQESNNWLEEISNLPIVFTPGTKFYYKEIDVYILEQILQRVTNMSIESFIAKELYDPLGIYCDKIDLSYGINGSNVENISALTAQEMLKIGELVLNMGGVEGQQILDKNYLNEAIKEQIRTKEFNKYFGMSSYGYLWWLCEKGYFARGFGGNEIAIFPEHEVVIVIQATAKKISKEYLDIIFDVILEDSDVRN